MSSVKMMLDDEHQHRALHLVDNYVATFPPTLTGKSHLKGREAYAAKDCDDKIRICMVYKAVKSLCSKN